MQDKIIMINSFEKYAQKYDKWFDNTPFTFFSELKLIISLMPKRGKGIDIGVGTGKFAQALGITTGVEPSLKMGEFAKKRGIKVYRAKAEKLPFKRGCFNYAVMITVLSFLNDPDKAFKEIYRILKKKGHFIIVFVDKDSPVGKYYLKERSKSKFYGKFYSVSEVIDLLNKHKFSVQIIRQTLFSAISYIKEKDLKKIEKFKDGYGEGSFVGIKALKKDG
ncbi:MAG: methyltransferase domain-containing protein [Candidatus Margulisbacteria bacterium]|nr:methyltransferase domain-containing protein [Candidatus Margulisiibacteriota bacterium]